MNAFTFMKVDRATFYRFIQDQSEGRYEYVRGRIMQQQQGGTLRHAQIAKRFLAAFDSRLDPAKWLASGSDRGVDTQVTIRYPDVSAEPVGDDPTSLSTRRPVAIVEVLSPSSEERDLDIKPTEYLSFASLQAYIIAGHDEAACLIYVRGADGRFPDEPETIQGLDKVIHIPVLALSIPLGDIYRGLVPESGCVR